MLRHLPLYLGAKLNSKQIEYSPTFVVLISWFSTILFFKSVVNMSEFLVINSKFALLIFYFSLQYLILAPCEIMLKIVS